MSEFNTYTSFIGEVLIYGSRHIRGFKSHPKYNYVLEHVPKHQGEEYLCHVPPTISIESVKEFCLLNDKFGDPKKEDFRFGKASPTSLRYVVHATIILSYLQSGGWMAPDIVEVGGGYGGLYLAIRFFAPQYGIRIASYTLVDLKEPLKLQKIYLSKHLADTNVDFVEADTFGKDIPRTDMFLISNYCFSSLEKNLQEQYQQHLFPKVAHGFMAWNKTEPFDFGFPFRSETEYPLTANGNKYLFF